jgi:hypothetical protein
MKNQHLSLGKWKMDLGGLAPPASPIVDTSWIFLMKLFSKKFLRTERSAAELQARVPTRAWSDLAKSQTEPQAQKSTSWIEAGLTYSGEVLLNLYERLP